MKKISFFALAHYYSHAILCTILFTISRAHSYSCQKCYYIFPKVLFLCANILLSISDD